MKTAKFGTSLLVLFTLAALALIYSTVAANEDHRSAVGIGQKAPAFQAQTMDGKTVNFPDDYKGKIVLLDFWATWCPDCRAELPAVVAAYNQFHNRGFEILGVSLDQSNQEHTVLQFIKDHQMPWPEIYDGKFWEAAVAKQYGIRAIPCPVLVSGDTGGEVIAAGASALGENLKSAVESSLNRQARK